MNIITGVQKMGRSRELVKELKVTPDNQALMDELLGIHAANGQWDELYGLLLEVLEGVRTGEALRKFQATLIAVMERHISHESNESARAALKLRVFRLLRRTEADRAKVLQLAVGFYSDFPGVEAAEEVLDYLEECGEFRTAARLATLAVGGCREPARRFTLNIRRGHLLLTLGELEKARQAFSAAALSDPKGKAAAAAEVKNIEGLMAKARKQLEAMGKGTSGEDRVAYGRMLLSLEPDDPGHIELLFQAFLENPAAGEAYWPLMEALEGIGHIDDMLRVIDARMAARVDAREEVELLLAKARLLADSSRKPEALNVLAKFKTRKEMDIGTVLRAVPLFARLDAWEELVGLYEERRQSSTGRDEEQRYLELEAEVLWKNLGDAERAERLYRRLRSMDPKNVGSLVFYEDYYRRAGDPRKLYSTLSTRLTLATDREDKRSILSQMVGLSEELGSPDRAVDALKKLIALDPSASDAGFKLEQIYTEQKKWHSLVDYLNARVEQSADLYEKAELLWRIREIYAAQDKLPVPEMEINVLKKITELNPQDERAVGLLIERYRDTGRWSALAETLEFLIENNPSPQVRKEMQKELAQVWSDKLKNQRKAMEVLERMLDMHVADRGVLEELAQLYRIRGLSEKLYEVLKELLVQSPQVDRPQLLEELYRLALDRLKRTSEAVTWLNDLLVLNPEDKTAWSRLASLYSQTEAWEPLSSMIEEKLAKSRSREARVPLLEELGEVYLEKMQDAASARRVFQELLQINPQSRNAKDNLRRIMVLESDWLSLRELFSKGKDWNPYLMFLEEQWKRATGEHRVAIGRELAEASLELLRDSGRAEHYLEELLNRVPDDVESAETLLFKLETRNEGRRMKALAVLADHGKGSRAEGAAVELASMLEESGKTGEAHARTLELLRRRLTAGDFGLLDTAIERAEAAESQAELVAMLQSVTEQHLGEELGVELAIRTAGILRERLRDLPGAAALLEKTHEASPHAASLLEELEKTYLAMGKLDRLERTLAAIAELPVKAELLHEKLTTLARLHEELLGKPDEAIDDYRRILELFPDDDEAFAGITRVLEDEGDFPALVDVLEQRVATTADRDERVTLLLRAATLCVRQLSDAARGLDCLERLLAEAPGLSHAMTLLEDVFSDSQEWRRAAEALKHQYRQSNSQDELLRVVLGESAKEENDDRRFELLVEAATTLEAIGGREEERFHVFMQALGIRPFDPMILELVQDCARQAGTVSQLAEFLKASVEAPADFGIGELSGEPRTATLLLAKIAEEELKDRKLAIWALEKALAAQPEDLEVMSRLERLLEEAGDRKALFALLEKREGLVFDEESRAAVVRKICGLMGQLKVPDEKAMTWLERSLELDPGDNGAAARLEELYSKTSRWKELSSLLRSRLVFLSGQDKSQKLFELASILKDHLEEEEEALDLLLGLEADPSFDRELLVGGLQSIILSQTVDQALAKRASESLVPMLEAAESWDTLATILEAGAEREQAPEDSAGQYLALARIRLERLDDRDGAFAAAGKALKANPQSGEAATLLAKTAAGTKKRLQSAKALLKECTGSHPGSSNPRALHALAELLQDEGSHQEAAAAMERLLELEPGEKEHYQRLLETYALLGRTEDRARLLEEYSGLLEDPEERADSQALQAQLLYELDRKSDAEAVLRRLLTGGANAQNQRDKGAMDLLETILEEQESWFELEEFLRFRAELCQDREEKSSYLLRAAVIQEEHMDNLDAAIELYNSVWLLGPSEKVAQKLGALLEVTSRFSELAALYEKQAESEKTPAGQRKLLLALARLETQELGRTDSALLHLARLVEANPADKEAGRMLLNLFQERQDLPYTASELLEKHLEAVRDYPALAKILLEQIERYPGEISLVEKHRALALLYETRLHDIEGAFMHICQAFRLEPGSDAIHEALLDYTEKKGAWDQLFDLYLDVLVELNSSDERNRLRRKMSTLFHDTLKDFERSELLYKDILDEDPADTFARERLIALYEEAEEWEKQVGLLRQSIGSDTGRAETIATLFRIAEIYRKRLDMPGEALDTLEEVLSVDPKQRDAYRSLEQIHFERSDPGAVAALLKRELQHITEPEDKAEVRMRLAHLLALELDDFQAALDEVETALRLEENTDGLAALLEECKDRLDEPEPRFMDLLSRIYASNREKTIELYQWAASKSSRIDEKLVFLERIHAIRLMEPKDPVGAYAVTKIMILLDPNNQEFRDRLLEYGLLLKDKDDFVSFLEDLLSRGVLDDDLGAAKLRLALAEILDGSRSRKADSAAHWEELRRSAFPALASKARRALMEQARRQKREDSYCDLLVEEAGTLSEVDGKPLLMEAAQLMAGALDRKEDAAELWARLASSFADDQEVLDQYEAVLAMLERREEHEALLRQRLAEARDVEDRTAVGLRLAGLLLGQEDRAEDGILAILDVMEEKPDQDEGLATLETLLLSPGTDTDLKLRYGGRLLDLLELNGEQDRFVAALESMLTLYDAPEDRLPALERLATALEKKGAVDAAIERLAELLTLNPGDEQVELRLETAAGGAARFALLKEKWTLLVNAGPDFAGRYTQKAARLCRDQLGQPAEAAALYEKLLELDPVNEEAADFLEKLYRDAKKTAELIHILELKADGSQGKRRTETGLELAEMLLSEGQLPRAIDWFNELLGDSDLHELAFERLSEIYQNEGRWEWLHDLLLGELSATRRKAERAELLGRIAALEEQFLEDREGAMSRYRELLTMNPDNVFAMNGLRRCYRMLEMEADLAELNCRLVTLSQDQEERLDILRENAQLYLGALENPEQALSTARAMLETTDGEEDAFTLLKELCDRDVPSSLPAAGLLQELAERKGEWGTAISAALIRMEGSTGAERVRHGLAAAELQYGKLEDPASALGLLDALTAENPDSGMLWTRIQSMAGEANQYSTLAEIIEKHLALVSDPSLRLVLLKELASLWSDRLDRRDDAIAIRQDILSEFFQDEENFSALEHLLQDMGRLEELASVYGDSAARTDNNDKRVFLLLKLAYLKEDLLHDRAGALDVLREVLTWNPENGAAVERLTSMLTDPASAAVAVEILEPVFQKTAPDRLSELALAKARTIEAGSERAGVLADAAMKAPAGWSGEEELLLLILATIGSDKSTAQDLLPHAEDLAQKLNRWLDLAHILEKALAQAPDEADLPLLRRLALIYEDKCDLASRAEQKLNAILAMVPGDAFALSRLEAILSKQGGRGGDYRTVLQGQSMSGSVEERREALLKLIDLAAKENDTAGQDKALCELSELSPDDPEILDRLVALRRGTGDTVALVEALERRLALLGGEARIEATAELASIMASTLGRAQTALSLLEDLVQEFPAHWDAVKALVSLLAREQNWRRAAEVLYGFACRSEVSREDAMERLWESFNLAFERLNDAGLAEAALTKILELDPQNVEALRARVRFTEGGDNPEAMARACDELAAALSDPTEKASALQCATEAMARAGADVEELKARINQALSIDPGLVTARRYRLELLEREEKWEEAARGYLELAELDPEFTVTAFSKAADIFLNRLGDTTSALEIVDRMPTTPGMVPELDEIRLQALQKADRYPELIEFLMEALKNTEEPAKRSQLALKIAVAHRDGLGQTEKFLAWIEEAHKAEENPAIVDELLQHYRSTGETRRIVSLLQWKVDYLVGRRKMKPVPGLLLELGALFEQLGQTEKALGAYRRIEEIDASFLPGLLALAKLLAYTGGQETEAFRLLQLLSLRAAELDKSEDRFFVHLQLAKLSLEKGQKSKAKQYLAKLSDEERKLPEVQELVDQSKGR